MKYAHYNEINGELLGWYDGELHGTYIPEVPKDDTTNKEAIPAYYDISSLPSPNIEVSEEDWKKAIDNGYNFVDASKGTLSKKDLRTFKELQTAKIASLKTDYENNNELDINYMSSSFQLDKNSQDLIVSVLSAGSVPKDFFWLDVDNNKVSMSYTDLQGLSSAVLTRNQINFVKYQGLKAQAKNATSQDELDSIIW